MNEDEQNNESKDDNKSEELPCTSRQAKASDRGDEKSKDDNSRSSVMDDDRHSSKSTVDDVRPHITEAKSVRTRRKKVPRRVRGRIQKRKRSTMRRVVRKAQPQKKKMPKMERRSRERSASTGQTGASSRSRSVSPCPHCGHRCRQPRYLKLMRRFNIGPKRNVGKLRTRRKTMAVQRKVSESIQVGSRCLMLSPLFVSTNATLIAEATTGPERRLYEQVTPEMIYESIRRLTMWTQGVATAAILEDMAKNYPVNPNQEELFIELSDKLVIAAEAGICSRTLAVVETVDGAQTHVAEDSWCLNCALRDRGLSKDQITIFWQIYADTLRPVTMQSEPPDSIEIPLAPDSSKGNMGAI